MSNRRVALAFDNKKDDMKAIETGISQSSSVSPILFLIYLRPLFDKIKKQYASTLLLSYINDVSILVSNKNVKQNISMLRDITYTAFKWADDNVVTFDDLKSELIHFETTHKMTREPIRLPNGTIIHPSEYIKWLEI